MVLILKGLPKTKLTILVNEKLVRTEWYYLKIIILNTVNQLDNRVEGGFTIIDNIEIQASKS